MGAAGRRFVETEFDRRALALEMLNVLEEVVELTSDAEARA